MFKNVSYFEFGSVFNVRFMKTKSKKKSQDSILLNTVISSQVASLPCLIYFMYKLHEYLLLFTKS